MNEEEDLYKEWTNYIGYAPYSNREIYTAKNVIKYILDNYNLIIKDNLNL